MPATPTMMGCSFCADAGAGSAAMEKSSADSDTSNLFIAPPATRRLRRFAFFLFLNHPEDPLRAERQVVHARADRVGDGVADGGGGGREGGVAAGLCAARAPGVRGFH